MDIVEKYGVTKSSIYEWLRKYGEECPNITGNTQCSIIRNRFVVYRFIDDNKNEYGLRWLCRKFSLSISAYYSYLEERKNYYKKCKRIILNTIKNIYNDNNRIIGYRGMVIFLKRKGINLSKITVHKYMNRKLNLHSVSIHKRVRYVRGERNEVFLNLVNCNFNTYEKNRIWCTDFTYIRLGNGRMRNSPEQ